MGISRRDLVLGGTLLPAVVRSQPKPLNQPRAVSIQAAIKQIDLECQRATTRGDWPAWHQAASPHRQELNSLVSAAFRAPRPSRFRDGKLALLRSHREPITFTAAGDCVSDCLYDFANPHQPLDPEAWIRTHRMVTQISALSNWLKSQGTELILVPVPRIVELRPSLFLKTDFERGTVEIAPHLRFLIRELLRANVEVLDLHPLLRNAADKGVPPVYLTTDPHWTDAAQRLTVKSVASRLSRFSVVQKARREPPVYRFRPATIRFGGYFYEYLTAEEAIALEPTMTQAIEEVVTTAGGRPFAASVPAPVMVVGDSFTSFQIMAIGREQSGEATALRRARDPYAEFAPPAGSGIVAYLAKELNLPVSHKAVLGSTLELFMDFFRDPALLTGVQTLVWIVNTASLFRSDAYPVNFRTPPVSPPKA